MPIECISEIILDVQAYPPEYHHGMRDFLAALNHSLDDINQDIQAYHAASNTSLEEKRARLSALEAKMQAIDDVQSDRYIVVCPEYFTQFHTKLFDAIQKEKQLLDKPAQPSTLADLIATMPPEKINELSEILANVSEDSLQARIEALYQPGEAGKQAFDEFLTNHRIRFLGGNNSKNFVVHHIQTREKQVLKIENRLGYPKQPERVLEQSNDATLSSALTTVYAERRTVYDDYNPTVHQRVARTLLVTDYCAGTDLETYGFNIRHPHIKLITAVSIHISMAEILESIQANQRAFPDMKNTNWLIDASNQVRLADRKSLVATNRAGEITAETRYLRSPYMIAPEMNKKPKISFSADKMHAYILSKNLYQYLTGCNIDAFYTSPDCKTIKLDASEFDFSHPIFRTPKGVALKQLLKRTLRENPDDRLSLSQVNAELKSIYPEYQQSISQAMQTLKKQGETHINLIQTYSISPADSQMQQLVTEQTQALQHNTTLQEQLNTERDLADKLNALKKIAPDIHKFQTITQELRSLELNALADQLEQKLCALPIQQRYLAFEPGRPEAIDFNAINAAITHKKCLDLLEKIKVYKITTYNLEDKHMNSFVYQMTNKLNYNQTPEEINKIEKKLKTTLNALQKADPIIQYINTLITEKKFGMEAKGKRVAEAMLAVPLNDRHNIPKGENPWTKRVLEAMASSRILPQFLQHRTREKNPAHMLEKFKNFKNTYQESELKKPEHPDNTGNIKPK